MSPRRYLVFDGACSVVHVVAARQQVQNGAVPLEGDVMALLRLMGRRGRGEKERRQRKGGRVEWKERGGGWKRKENERGGEKTRGGRKGKRGEKVPSLRVLTAVN